MPRRKKKPKRRGYVRPSRAKPKAGWSLRELSALTGVAVRSIRLYLQREVLPRPRFMASATRYQRVQLVWLLAIRRLRAAEKLTLAAIRTRLLALSASELEAFATASLPPGALADALGIRPTASAPSAPTPSGGSSVRLSPHLPRWARIELALGLELHVREDASGRTLDLAHRVRELCASGIEVGG